ncbi:MAG: methyl-accepting chemotaxis protein [Gammaproteobacteria bacterium]|nr:methyl-accepting chemotaxis protein [Gammaproteobacteria bacterium]
MTNKGSGSQHIPALVGLGVILLAAVLVILLRGSDGAFGDSRLATLALAQATVTDAVRVLETHSDEAYAELKSAAQRLGAVDTRGLTSAQSSAIRSLQSHASTLQDGRDAHATLAAANQSLDQIVPIVIDRANILEQAAIVQNRSIVAAQLERMRMLASGIRRDTASLTRGGSVPAITSQNMLDADMAMAQIVRGFEEGDPVLGLRAVSDGEALEALSALRDATARLGDAVRDVLAVADQLGAESALRQQLLTVSAELSPVALASAPGAAIGGSMQRNILAGLIGAAVSVFALIGWMTWRARDFSKATALQAEQQERNQKAIMRLLDELGSLADGDLTVKATVTEEITGAIADSINYAIEALRELVVTVNESSIMVDGAAKQTDMTAQQLAEASQSQSKQIEAASDAIMSMVASIEEISGNAERSSDVARHSVDVAHKGGDAVRRTIEGMNTIRETIQDTAKRIKRLGESSQEIGNIVELINDIADQTNILALNASIQASMAGEAGRGFAVVADEVQRLAERSANATKQIEVLVRTIQNDTNEAVVSMERSTTDVVGGALLAENAGAALEEIEQVSNQIASLVQNISSSAREQSGAAATVTRNMDRLQEINADTEASTSATTESIRKLAELSAQLRESVAGFRLPGNQIGDVDEIVDEIEDEILGNLVSDATDDSPSDDSKEVSYVDQKTA